MAPWQLPYYLDEFTFRFNRRRSKSRGKLFFRLMQQAVNTPPATYEALIKVQGETLDNLAEAVAVFGSDGRLRLFNPVFARMWKLESNELAEHPHIEAVIGWCKLRFGEHDLWPALCAAIARRWLCRR